MVTHIQEIDVLRSVAIIFIIFAHIDSFTSFPIFDELDEIFAFFGLSIFFFISGFLMQKNNNFATDKDVSFFFKKRVLKIYPLYWLSIVAIYAMDKIGFDVVYSNDIVADKFLLLSHIFGFQGLIHEDYALSVWWFVGVILLYYFLFSIILHYSKSFGGLLAYSFFMVLPLLFLRNEFNLVNVNFFSYYFIFIAGILSAAAENLESFKKITLSYSVLLLSFLLMSYLGINTNYLSDISKRDIVFLIFVLIFTLYNIKFSCQNKFKIPMYVKKLADSSYSVYLFHIPLLTLFQSFILMSFSLEILNGHLFDYLTLFLGIPFTLFSGYFIMIYLDKLSNKYKKKFNIVHIRYFIGLMRQIMKNHDFVK